jgi:hypothetical protein
MRTYFIYIFIFFTLKSLSQDKFKNFRFTLRAFRETDKPFKFKHNDIQHQVFARGVGCNLRYDYKINKMIKISPILGEYYFWNNEIKFDNYNNRYKENNLVFPLALRFNLHSAKPLDPLSKKISFSFSASFGRAFIKNAIIYQDFNNVSVNKKWRNYIDVCFEIFIPFTKKLPYLKLGVGYTNLDGKHINSAFY